MIFISHSSADALTAGEICKLLEQNSLKCFIAPRDIRSGREYAEEILNGIDASEAMVLLMSEAANASPHVLREVERAVSKNIPILVYKLEPVALSRSLEYFLMTHQWINQENRGDYNVILTAVRELSRDRGAAGSPTKSADSGKNGGAGKSAGYKWVSVGVGCAGLAAVLLGVFLCLKTAGLPLFGTSQNGVEVSCILQAGDTISLGSYNNEPIQWRVLRLEERDGRQTAVLVSKYIITMKAFDAAESGRYNHDENRDYISRESEADFDMELQAYVRGNSSWRDSNIRAWLNAETELVAYGGQAPVSSAMSELHNGYQNEPGFLYNFTEEEIGMLVERECRTPGNALEEGDIVTLDRVFLLSEEELVWFDEAGISRLSVPTEAALEQDMSQWYEVSLSEHGVKEYAWWLRTPAEGYSSKAYLVENGYGIENEEISNNLRKASVGLEGFGIRPAITIDLEKYAEAQRQ